MIIEHFFKISSPLVCLSESEIGLQMQNFAISRLYPLTSIAFPLSAFLLTEGFTHTHSRWTYRRAILLFALISELPLDLVFVSSGWNFSLSGLTRGGAPWAAWCIWGIKIASLRCSSVCGLSSCWSG